MSNLAKSLYETTQLIINHSLSQINSDITAVYVISDDSKSSIGEYKVSTNKEGSNVNFVAYTQSNDTYKYQVGDSVYVLIPGGKYEETKFIVGLSSGSVIAAPTDKETASSFIALQSFNYPIAETAIPVTNSSKEIKLFDTTSFLEPLVLVNYSKIRITATLKVNVGEAGQLISPESGIYAIRLKLKDNTNNQTFFYSLGSTDILGNVYHYGETFYTFTKDLPISANHFEIGFLDCYWIQEGEFKDTNGNKIETVRTEISDIKIELGWNALEYKDNLYIYEVQNRKTVEGAATYYFKAKINYQQKEYSDNAIKNLNIEGKQYELIWLKKQQEDWVVLKKQETLDEKCPVSLEDEILSTIIKAQLKEKVAEEGETAGSLLTSLPLEVDNIQKMLYNYSVQIENSNGLLLRPGTNEKTTLTAVLYQNNIKFTVDDYFETPADFSPFILYHKIDTTDYFIKQGDKKCQVSFLWNDKAATALDRLEVKAGSEQSSYTYSCIVRLEKEV